MHESRTLPILLRRCADYIAALQDYDSRILRYGAQLEEYIQASEGQPIHVNELFHWFTFDVMGDLALAKSFNMLLDKKLHHAILMMRDFMWLLGPFSPVPWLARIALPIPGVAQGWKNFIYWCQERMSERIAVCTNLPLMQLRSSMLIRIVRTDRA